MTPLPWYERLHVKGAIALLVILILVEIPIWMWARSLDFDDPDRALARALGLATVGALVALAIHAGFTGLYLRRRIDSARRAMLGAVADERIMQTVTDEIALLADEVSTTMVQMRTSMVRLQQERGRLRTLLEGMGEAVLMLDDAERVLVANSVAEKLLNLPDEYVGERLHDVCAVNPIEAVVSEVLWAHEAAAIEVDVRRKGELRHISVTATPIMSSPTKASGVVVVMFDNTTLRHLERVRRDFVANVSHELRTPIASIRSAAETLLLAELKVAPEYTQFLQTIERNAVRMGSIVEDLLVLSRLEAAGEEIELGPVRLADVFAEIVDQCEPLAREKGVELGVDISDDTPDVYAEHGALRQILQNLTENGIKYTPGGGSVTIKARPKGHKRIRVTVRDTGPGIGQEHLPRIFERFYRVDTGRSRAVGGTGLGLAIVKHLVRKLKGRIEVDSEPDHGTTFTLLLRVYRPETE